MYKTLPTSPVAALIVVLALTTSGFPSLSLGQELNLPETAPANTRGNPPVQETRQFSTQELLTDMVVLRPVGLVGTLIGSALFVGLIPFTALASIADKEAFHITGQTLIVTPAKFTFTRPLGQYPRDYYPPR
jgi:hypothetical protein